MKVVRERKKTELLLLVLVLTVFQACKEPEIIPPDPDPDPGPDPIEQIDPEKIVAINTDMVDGQLYNFWSTRPMVNQTRFSNSNFLASIEPIKDYVKDYNIVRILGGRTDNRNTFYKGVDASGNVITDFSSLLNDLRGLIQVGFKPRIVLDNVPWDMSLPRVVDQYGNTKPPSDYNLWRQYINAFLQTLVTEFGMTEVSTWRFRVATEPNYSPQHWRGTKEEYFKHYDITVDEVLKVIPDATIGPGNMLTESVSIFTTELIDHCATGTNYATGEIGTQMDFFAISYYEKIDQNTVRLPEKVEPYRLKLNSYSQFMNIPLDIHEFGMLRDENGIRGISLTDATELGASWYATVADMAYQYNIAEIYDWGQEIEASNLPQGRKNVMRMLQKMEGGDRLQAIDMITDYAGIIPVVKADTIYLLVYNHSPSRTATSTRTLYPKIEGGIVSEGQTWSMDQWTIDNSHGIMMHALYDDLRAAGVSEKTNGRIYGNRPSDRFEDAWKTVLSNNLARYEELAELPLTITDSTVEKSYERLLLEVDLTPHSVKLIRLTPQ